MKLFNFQWIILIEGKAMSYPSDLSKEEFELIHHHFDYSNGYGNRRKIPLHRVINAILYVVKTGCQWRQLPNDFPNWKSVYSNYMRWCERGVWEKALDEINEFHRKKKGRKAKPTYVIIDSQSTKTVSGGEHRGYDGGKKNKRS